jgi:hypothetical protein
MMFPSEVTPGVPPGRRATAADTELTPPRMPLLRSLCEFGSRLRFAAVRNDYAFSRMCTAQALPAPTTWVSPILAPET